MNFIKQHYDNIIQYDFINKFSLNNVSDIPKITKIVVSFNFANYSKKKALSCLLAIKLLTGQNGLILTSKTHNLRLKIKKGSPVACLVVLKKQSLETFLETFLFSILPNLNLEHFVLKNANSLSFRIPKSFLVNELNNFYSFFKDILDLNITIVSKTENILKLVFLFNSFNIKSSTKH